MPRRQVRLNCVKNFQIKNVEIECNRVAKLMFANQSAYNQAVFSAKNAQELPL